MDMNAVKTTDPPKRMRAGLYIEPETRNRLNYFKARLSLTHGTVYSQDDAIVYLLDKVESNEADAIHQTA